MPVNPPWGSAEFIDETNVKQGVSMEGDGDEYVRLDRERFRRVMRRVSELHLLDPGTLSEAGAQEAFKDARRAAELLISDRLARRGWIRRTFGWLW